MVIRPSSMTMTTTTADGPMARPQRFRVREAAQSRVGASAATPPTTWDPPTWLNDVRRGVVGLAQRTLRPISWQSPQMSIAAEPKAERKRVRAESPVRKSFDHACTNEGERTDHRSEPNGQTDADSDDGAILVSFHHGRERATHTGSPRAPRSNSIRRTVPSRRSSPRIPKSCSPR